MAATNMNMQGQDKLILADNAQSDELEIDLLALMYRLIEKLKWLIAAGLLGALLAGLYTAFLATPLYESTSKLYVINAKDNAIDLTSLNMGDKLAADYVQVFDNWHVHEKVISSLNLPYNYKEIRGMLEVSVPTNTRIIEIKVTSDDPLEAKNIAMAYAEFAPAFIEAKMETDRPNIFEEARVAEKPSSPSMVKNVVLGCLLAGILAAGIVVVQFIVDDRILNSDMVEKRLGLPVLGMMPVQESQQDDKKSKKHERSGSKA